MACDQPAVPHIGHLVRIPFQAVSGEVMRRCTDAGFDDIRPAHLVVFQHIRKEGSRLTELAARAQLTPQSMGYLVDHLESSGYVERRPDPTDRRAALICLTDRGWSQVRCALGAIADIEQRWAAAIGARRYKDVKRALSDLCEILARDGYV